MSFTEVFTALRANLVLLGETLYDEETSVNGLVVAWGRKALTTHQNRAPAIIIYPTDATPTPSRTLRSIEDSGIQYTSVCDTSVAFEVKIKTSATDGPNDSLLRLYHNVIIALYKGGIIPQLETFLNTASFDTEDEQASASLMNQADEMTFSFSVSMPTIYQGPVVNTVTTPVRNDFTQDLITILTPSVPRRP